jgi:EAL domain-containing protein (putative c-di-GMP-specific phosphodiesterase class I)
VTAEGIETIEQHDYLRDLACDRGQGYFFSRPLSAQQLEEYLRTRGLPAAGSAGVG